MSARVTMALVQERPAPRPAEMSGAKRALVEQRLRAGFQTAPKAQLIPRHAHGENAPLSFAQQRLWFIHELDPQSPLYNMPMAVELNGRLDEAALRRAIAEIVERHEVLRTRYESVDGCPVQVVGRAATVALPVTDLRAETNGGHDASVRHLLREEACRPFDLTRDLMLRARLLRLGDDEHVLVVTMHHIASDGWSWGVFFHELAVLYRDFAAGRPASLPELPMQYADYAVWQRQWLQGDALERQLGYWKKRLAGAPDVLELPADRARPPVQAFRGHWQALELPAPLGGALQALSRREGVTLFMTLLAAFMTLLHRCTRQTDLIVGTPVAGRTQKETEGLIGFFVNTLALRGDLAGDPTFRELLGRVRELTLEAFTHQDLPFEKLVEALRIERSPGQAPLVQVMFVLQNTSASDWQLPGLTMTPMELDTGTAKFDLTLAVEETAHGLTAVAEYSGDLFDAATIARMLGHWRTLLEGIVADPDRRIAELPLLTEGERHQLLVEWNATATGYPRDKIIGELFSECVAHAPNAIAVICEHRRLTYRELDAQANQLAHHLRSLGVRPDTLVGVCLERSLELIVTLLGIVKAGGAYVALDPAYPKERLALMLGDTRATVLVTQKSREDFLPAGEWRVWRVDDEEMAAVNARSAMPFVSGATPDSLAYVSFTSGSTGRPKGVAVPQRGVVRLVKGTNYVRLDAGEVFLQLAPVGFDASTFEIWGALLNGARLVVYPPPTPTLTELGAAIREHGVTTLWLTAGLFHQMVLEQPESLRGVRQLLTGGDVLSVQHVRQALVRAPGCRLFNGYGPTENTTFTCCHRITPESVKRATIPIGRPIANTQAFVLDDEMQPVPVGVPGELYAGGDGLARGYIGRDELTAERFVPHPFSAEPGARLYRTGDLVRWLPNGELEFLGRLDSQVKIRGFRVEPAEVEAALAAHPSVRESAVVVRAGSAGERSLVACVVARSQPAPTADDLRSFLQGKLPGYLVPAAFVFCDALPLTANGKVDRRALARLEGTMPAVRERKLIAPRCPVERGLVEIWEDILNVRPVGVTDKFFELGGHSLLAVRLLARIEKVFGKKLPLATVFQAATIGELAPIVRGKAEATAGTSLVEIQAHGRQPPLFLVHGVGGGMFWGYGNLARHLGDDQPLHAFKSRGLDGLAEFETIEEMAAHYVADLRAFQPEGPYRIGGYCFGGNVAYEMARQLHAAGERVAVLVLMNCTPTSGSYARVRVTPAWVGKFLRNLGVLLAAMARWDAQQRRAFLQWKWRTWKKKLQGARERWGRAAVTSAADEIVDLSAYPDEQRRLWAAHIRGLQRHRTRPYEGCVVLFRSRMHQLVCSFAADFGWGEFARGGVTVTIVPGAHESILEEPHVRVVAEELRACLHAIRPAEVEATVQ
ncbi:MAG: amino acid adenylation domain-containing protein [Verrucomicrobia bacterium]|nr:amino acid adenylation domain-containing protein [Verrucomicrobiota bacterium]